MRLYGVQKTSRAARLIRRLPLTFGAGIIKVGITYAKEVFIYDERNTRFLFNRR